MAENVSLFFINGLGDQLIALPAVRALAKLFPDRIQLMLGEWNFRFLFADAPLPPDPVRIWWKDGRPEVRTVDVDRIVQEAAPSDLFISLATSVSPSFMELAERLGARRTVGFFDCFSEPLPWRERNMFDLLFTVPKHFDPSLRFEDFCAPPRFEAGAEAAAARVVERCLAPGEKLLFLHAETSFADKAWSAEHFSWVLERFLEQQPEYRVLVCGKEPYALKSARHQDRIIQFNEHLQLSLATLRYADLFLGVDSCFLHGADLFRVPSVALFGPTDWKEWGIRLSPHARHVTGNGSMAGVRREEVLDSLLALAGETAAPVRSAVP